MMLLLTMALSPGTWYLMTAWISRLAIIFIMSMHLASDNILVNLRLLSNIEDNSMTKNSIVLLHIVILTCVSFVMAQETPFVSNVSKRGTTAASFLEIGVGARALA